MENACGNFELHEFTSFPFIECVRCGYAPGGDDEDSEQMFTTISETVDAYNEMLDSCHDPIGFAGFHWEPSVALKVLDPCAYKCGWIDYMDSMGVETDDLENDYTFDWDR